MMKSVLTAAILIGLAAPPALAQGVDADAVFHATTLSLQAEGEAKAAPDMASITLGVTTLAPSAAEAMRLNAGKMNAILAALRGQGLAERDIQTSNLSLGPQYVYLQNEPPKLTGYQASNDVTVTVRDLSRLGPAIDAVSAAIASVLGERSARLMSAVRPSR